MNAGTFCCMVMIIIHGAMYPGGQKGADSAHRLAAQRGGKIQTKIQIMTHLCIPWTVRLPVAGGRVCS